MADASDNEDKHLLERLNALKPSSVQLERQKNVALNNSVPPFSVFDNSTDFAAVPGKLDDFATGSLLAEDDILAPESLLNGDAIEDLLASLDNNQQLDLGVQFPDNTEHEKQEQEEERDQTNTLLSGAYEFVQNSSVGPGTKLNTSSHASLNRKDDIPHFLRSEEENEEGEESSSDEEKDEVEAAKYVEDLLKEIQANPPSESPTGLQREDLPAEATTSESYGNRNNNSNENIENDDNLSTRLAALSLPSVPSDQPGTRSTTRIESTSPECCCICYDTPAVKCTDCEGDQLFCVLCWWEMHMADGSDLTESRHRAIKYEPS